MKKVLLRAPLLTNSGYGVHSRQLFEWLYEREDVDLTVECLQWGRTAWIVNDTVENGIYKKIMNCSRPVKEGEYDVSFQVQLPDEWNTKLAKKNIGVTALIETDKCSPEWVDKCNQMDHIIVPSTFTKNVLKRSGPFTKSVTVIPEWFNGDVSNRSLMSKTLSDERYNNIDSNFCILMIGTLTSQIPEDDRKNLVNSIKWLCEEFKDNKDVEILLKTNFGKGTAADKKMCKKYLANVINKNRSGSAPKFKLIHGNMKKEEVAALYNHNKVKLYVTATRGEGYGLPLIEAAASGVPIVATGWSGHLEFLDKDLIGSVDYNLVPVNKTKVDGRIFKESFKWADPISTSFKRNVRDVYENYDKAKNNAKILKKKIQHSFNKAAIKRQYDKLFSELV